MILYSNYFSYDETDRFLPINTIDIITTKVKNSWKWWIHFDSWLYWWKYAYAKSLLSEKFNIRQSKFLTMIKCLNLILGFYKIANRGLFKICSSFLKLSEKCTLRYDHHPTVHLHEIWFRSSIFPAWPLNPIKSTDQHIAESVYWKI